MEFPNTKVLYKYKPINQFTLDIIANNRIYFPVPDSFNDPFDTQCSFKNKIVRTQVTDQQKIAKIFPDEKNEDMSVYTKTDQSQYIDKFKAKLEKIGVLSLAEDAKNILMWSHYADEHRGLCIGFERNESNDLGEKSKTRKVHYTKGYPSLTAKSLVNKAEQESSLLRVLYTKSALWSYEQEWRMFLPKGNKVYPVPGKIKSI